MAQQQAALKDREQLVQKKQEDRTKIETHAKEQLKNEELALKKAKELARKTSEERREAQKDVSRLTQEEQDAKKKMYDLGKEAHIKVEEKPATVDVYQHTRYETSKFGL